MIRPPTIRSKLFGVFLLAAVLPIVVVGLVSYLNSLRSVESMVGNRTAKVSAVVCEDLERKISDRLGDQLLVTNEPVQHYLATLTSENTGLRLEAYNELEYYLRRLFDDYGNYYRELIIADADGRPVFSFGRSRSLEAATSVIAAQIYGRPSAPTAVADSLSLVPDPVPFSTRLEGIQEFGRTLGERIRQRTEEAEEARRQREEAARAEAEREGRAPLPPDPPAVPDVPLPEVLDAVREAFERAEGMGLGFDSPGFDGPAPREGRGGVRVPITHEEFSDDERKAAQIGTRLARDENLIFIHKDERNETEAIRLVRPIFSVRDRDERLGSLITDIRVDYLFPENLSAEAFGTGGQVVVVNENGEVLFHSSPEYNGRDIRSLDPEMADAVRIADDTDDWMHLSDRLAAVSEVNSVPWAVVATAYPNEFTSEAKSAALVNLMIAVFAVIVAFVILLTFSNRISRSVHVVTDGARAIAAGNLHHTIHVDTHDEIQTLAEAFNGMTESLRENIALREKAARELEMLARSLEDRVEVRTRELQGLNEALNQANQELKELDRLKSNFLATVSHEFRTPLTSITAFSEILLDEMDDVEAPEEVSRFLGIINTESERLGRLIKNLLDLSRIEAGRIKWDRSVFPMQDVVEAAADGLLPVFAEKHLEIVREVECGGARVEADQDRIQQVITNLLENASKFSDRGSRIWVTCEPESSGNGRPMMRVSVRDEGAGIPQEYLERIFERFSQVDSGETRSVGGSGLGLAISKEIVEHHGGRIWAESKPGQGATFFFTLPVLPADAEPSEAGSPASEDLPEEKHA